ncbi:aldo/keto reductase [Ulvibacterium marinum]|uniref:aldo/keto reductase n=1 Tax=Ulvibacterium marinum TaxID=2419782 RepID=UPI002495A3E5|nr:aldo/keto reductase [Ulvibacterium marinum]
MKKVELFPGIQSSVLGFGCASVMGARGPRESYKALNLALDYGITHFDLARSYGYGEAEIFVGKVLSRKRRDRIVISSKFGIKANGKARMLKPFKPIIRKLKRIKPHKSKAILNTSNSVNPFVTDKFHDRVEISGQNMVKSLESSLRALNTNYLDYFFVHEPIKTIERIDEVLETAEKLKQKGLIRAIGLAFMQSQQNLHEKYIQEFDILQFNNSPGIENYDTILQKRSKKSNVFFSPINGGVSRLAPNEKLETLHKDFPKSVILCATFDEKHMKQNVNLFS